jgi:hypothetical protein
MWLDDALPQFIAHRPLNLSKTTRLGELKFECTGLTVEWITTTLRSAQYTTLRKITIVVSDRSMVIDPVEEAIRREWQDLDHLLDQLWTSRSVCPEITYKERRVANGLGELVLSLLPKLAGKGAVAGVGVYTRRSEW